MSILFRSGGGRRRGVTMIPGVVLLLDAARSIPNPQAPQHGAPVAVLRDQSGKGNHASQSETANQPRVDLNACPGRPTVQFQGPQHLTVPAPAAQVVTVYALVMVSPAATAPQVVIAQDTTAATTLPGWEVQIG